MGNFMLRSVGAAAVNKEAKIMRLCESRKRKMIRIGLNKTVF